jgi:ABC-type nitrate/sulfonate/bicarbonate transport system permease component
MVATDVAGPAPRVRARAFARQVTVARIAIAGGALVLWELLARSGLLFEGVVPQLAVIVAGLGRLLASPAFYANLQTTAGEVGTALVIGGAAGLLFGLILGANRFLGRAFEPYLYYLGPTPKIIFFPVMIMWFGTGPGSKVAMGALSCFFPVALSVAAGIRQIDQVLIRVGHSFRANAMQMATKIYLPALREPVVNSFRLGLGVAVIGVLLAETKLSNRGLGFMVIDSYSHFDMPSMYALVIVIFVLAIGLNGLLSRIARGSTGRAVSSGTVG